MVRKGVVIAAGRGTRLSPANCAVSKEVLPIGGLPAVHHVVCEFALCGITEVLVVISRGKEDILRYFTAECLPCKEGFASLLTERRNALCRSVNVSVAYQQTLLGTGNALLCAEAFTGNDAFAVAYPDDLILLDTPKGACGIDDGGYLVPAEGITLQAMCGIAESGKNVVATQRIAGVLASHYGIVEATEHPAGGVAVSAITEKPTSYKGRFANALLGRFVFTPDIYGAIKSCPQSDGAGIIPAINVLAAKGTVQAVRHSGGRYDIGTHLGYMAANAACQTAYEQGTLSDL